MNGEDGTSLKPILFIFLPNDRSIASPRIEIGYVFKVGENSTRSHLGKLSAKSTEVFKNLDEL